MTTIIIIHISLIQCALIHLIYVLYILYLCLDIDIYMSNS